MKMQKRVVSYATDRISRDCAKEPAYITRYGRRAWAVYWHGELLAVTLYRKGARAVADCLVDLTSNRSGT